MRLSRDSLAHDQEADRPNSRAASINVIRRLQGIVVWGGRTLSSDPEWRYVNARRFALLLERSISEGTQWAVFEPNGERLWIEVRRRVEAFMLAYSSRARSRRRLRRMHISSAATGRR